MHLSSHRQSYGLGLPQSGDYTAMQSLASSEIEQPMKHLPGREIGFSTNNNTRYILNSAILRYFVMDDLNHLKRRARGNGIDEHITMDPNRMLRIERGVLILQSAEYVLEAG